MRKAKFHTIVYGEPIPEVGSQFEKTDCLIIVQTEAGGNNVKLLYADGNGKVVENVPENSDSYWTKEQYEDNSFINTTGSVGINLTEERMNPPYISDVETPGEYLLDIQPDTREIVHSVNESEIGVFSPIKYRDENYGFIESNSNDIINLFSENYIDKLVYEVLDSSSITPTGDSDVIFSVDKSRVYNSAGELIVDIEDEPYADYGTYITIKNAEGEHTNIFLEDISIIDEYTSQGKVLKLKSYTTVNNDSKYLRLGDVKFNLVNGRFYNDKENLLPHILVENEGVINAIDYETLSKIVKSILLDYNFTFTEEEKNNIKQKLGI